MVGEEEEGDLPAREGLQPRSGCPDPIGWCWKFTTQAINWGNFLVKGTGPLKHTWALVSSRGLAARRARAEPCRVERKWSSTRPWTSTVGPGFTLSKGGPLGAWRQQ